MAEVELIAEGLAFPEGPVVMADGSVILVEIHAGKVTMHPLGDRLVTNLAFGGPDMMDVWLTYSERGALVRTRWHEPGMTLMYNG